MPVTRQPVDKCRIALTAPQSGASLDRQSMRNLVMFTISRSSLLRGVGALAFAAAVALPLTIPSTAHAWWRGGWGWGGGVYIAPPAYYAPPPAYYAPPPAYYAPPPVAYAPGMIWFGPHWDGGYWVRGHWGWR